MNVLVIGSGGREHAISYQISKSKLLTKLFVAPGNPGTKNIAENVELNINIFNEVLNFCIINKIELVVIGPEKPLVDGMADFLRENNIKVFGPNKNAAQLEAHKSFSKHFMKRYSIPTAEFEEFNNNEYDSALSYCKNQKYPLVIKADGLAAGKGVIICNNFSDVKETLKEIFINKIFGDAGNKIVIEEFMEGEEASVFAITDGNNYITLPSAQDHKRIGNNDTGKNTGGMGAYSPAPIVNKELLNKIDNLIIKPTLKGMSVEGNTYNGCLYCGLMIQNNEPKVVEFNCRFGDPETQAVLPLLNGDFLELLYTTASGEINRNSVKYNGGSAVCVVAASKGYPDSFEKGFNINGLNEVDSNCIVFHAGTKEESGKILTNGGRVLGITAINNTNNLAATKEIVYNNLLKINFQNIYYRTDIADKGIKL